MSFDKEAITHYAEYSTSYPTICGIAAENIKKHSETYGYPLYAISNLSHVFQCYGVLRTDWSIFFKSKAEHILPAYVEGDHEEHIYVCFTDDNFNVLKDCKPSAIETYIVQRYFYPENVSILDRPTKKLEFELGFQLIVKLSDLLVFNHQKNIMNYFADFLFEFKNNMNRDIPSIVVEVNEDDHVSYDQEKEKFRQSVIEAFNNRFIKISISRTATQSDIEEIAKKYEIVIRSLAKDLIIDYSLDVSEEDFVSMIEKHNIDKAFIKMFMAPGIDRNFKYTHQEVAEYLGYGDVENYKHFLKLMKNKMFVENIDWKIQKVARRLTVERLSGNAGNGGLNKMTYLLTRATFCRICINSPKSRAKQIAHYFAAVYEAAIDYVQKLRSRNLGIMKSQVEHQEAVKQRVDDLVTQRVDKTSFSKLEKENKMLKEKFDSMKAENEEIVKENDDLKISMQSALSNISTYELSIGELSEYKTKTVTQIRKMKKELLQMKEKFSKFEELTKKNDLIDQKMKDLQKKYDYLLDSYNEIIDLHKKTLKENKKLQEENKKLQEDNKKLQEDNKKLQDQLDELKKKLNETSSEKSVPVFEKAAKEPVKNAKYTQESLLKKTVVELKEICRTNKFAGFSAKKKDDLVIWMLTKF